MGQVLFTLTKQIVTSHIPCNFSLDKQVYFAICFSLLHRSSNFDFSIEVCNHLGRPIIPFKQHYATLPNLVIIITMLHGQCKYKFTNSFVDHYC